MSSTMSYRIYVGKKEGFDHRALQLEKEWITRFPLISVSSYVVYDIFGVSDYHIHTVAYHILSEKITDKVFFEFPSGPLFVGVEYLPGQFDQRAYSAEQAIMAALEDVKPIVRTAILYQFSGISTEQLKEIENYLINPVDSQKKDFSVLELPSTSSPQEVKIIENFVHLDSKQLFDFYQKQNFAFDFEDLVCIQNYFKNVGRNPTETEIKVLDTYWSDHCRHTTFLTELNEIEITGELEVELNELLQTIQHQRKEIGRDTPLTLMELATHQARYLSKKGKLPDVVQSEEVNACTIRKEIMVDGKKETWDILFKNETHNHPTEIEPFGGASTCLGGAIRDPLSGRAYVYQAMRISGAANPWEPLDATLKGKLPQRKITKEATLGFSSYGNQIGLATTYVREIYHEGYRAKRMEVGAVVGAVPSDWVQRVSPMPDDVIVILGGRTGRDGIGGATGSSQTHTVSSIQTMSAEVQKGDAVQERKLQRLYRNPNFIRLIKKCNDFGAGGVAVAIGEIADGVEVNLDAVPLKYQGLNGTEIAISESQERMAVVIEQKDWQKLKKLSEEEGVEATIVGRVTKQKKVVMMWRGEKIVDLDRSFLNTNGAKRSQKVLVKSQIPATLNKTKNNLLEVLELPNVASQKGLVEHFDSTVGQTTVLMPFGGKFQLTPSDASIQTIAALEKNCETVGIFSCGEDINTATISPFHAGMNAVVDAIAKVIACGGDFRNIYFSFQEYFEKLTNDPARWGKPFQALIGANLALQAFDLAAIGGKDSMSGSFEDLDVPPTLLAFAYATADISNVVGQAFEETNHYVYGYFPSKNAKGIFDFDEIKLVYQTIHQWVIEGKISSMKAVGEGGWKVAVVVASLGNAVGGQYIDREDGFIKYSGGLVISSKEPLSKNFPLVHLGTTNASKKIVFGDESFTLKELAEAYHKKFELLFPTGISDFSFLEEDVQVGKSFKKNYTKVTKVKPTVCLPIFPGTNCEYETSKVFKEAGGEVIPVVINTLTTEFFKESIDKLVGQLKQSQILCFSGGFSAGDEPDGSAKFMVSVLNNPKVKEAIYTLLEHDGLILGICNGFQALIKSGLLPFGRIQEQKEGAPTLTHNRIGRHISQLIRVKVINDRSPWLSGMKHEVYAVPVSHGEGRFYAAPEILEVLHKNEQVATCYVDHSGKIADDEPFNPNGSIGGVEGITDPSGRIYGRMAHPERFRDGLMKNIPNIEFMDIFQNGVRYFE